MDSTAKAKLKHNLFLSLVASLTLGLAPFFPEPHFFGKVRWVAGGAHGMSALDWFDFLMHGAPWAALIYFTIKWLLSNRH